MRTYRIPRLILAFGLLLSFAAPILPASAAGASITLSANKSTVANGGSVVIAIYMNGGGAAINAVQADVSYSSSKLQYIGYSATGSAFEIGAANGGSDGLASVSRGTTSAVSGSALVGTMTFRALVGSGSATFGVAGSSSLVSDGTAIAYGSSGASVNFGAASSGGSSPAAPAAPAAPKDTTPPTISAVKATAVTPFSATITWTTNEGSDSAVDYGLDANYGLSASASAPATTHSVPLSSSFLTPLTLLHYRVKSTDAAGNVATGTDQTLQLPGVAVTIIVRGPDGQPQSGATVTLDSATGTTDSKGEVTLASSLGNKQVTTTYQGVTIHKPITVTKSAKPLPPIQLDLARQPLNHWMLTSAGLVVVVITLLGIDAVLFGSRLLGRATGLKFAASPATHRHFQFASLTNHLHRPKPASVPGPAVASEPVVPQPAPTAEVPPEAGELDPLKTVAELMGGPPPATTDLSSAGSPATPNGVTVPPVSPVVTQIAVSHTASETSPAAAVAHRLKKPAAHKQHAPAKTSKAKKP